MSRLYGWIAAAFALMGAALLYVAGQRDRAREAATRAKAEAQGRKAVQEAERTITRLKAQAREQSAEVQREQEGRPTDQRPSGSFRR